MGQAILSYLKENSELIHETLEDAAKASISVSELGSYVEELVSVVLTQNFELETIQHPASYHFSTNVLHVLCSFECETYIVDYEDVKECLSTEQANKFEESLLEQAIKLLQLESDDEIEGFIELSRGEKLDEVKTYLYENQLILELLKEFDKGLYEKYLKQAYDSFDVKNLVEVAMERIFDNLTQI